MWPLTVDWRDLRFGVEIEFVVGAPAELELLPGWQLPPGESMDDDDGTESGGELLTPPLPWHARGQIREMVARLRGVGARATWSCGLHVHVGLEPWGQAAVVPLLDAALSCQDALRELLGAAPHRLWYCPPVTAEMRAAYLASPGPDALERRGRPQSHRCGVNAKSWFDHGTLEIRYANGTLRYGEIVRTVDLCLRFVAAVGAGRALPATADELAGALGAPRSGYPSALPAPLWYWQRLWLEEALMPALGPLALERAPGEVLSIRPAAEGRVAVVVEGEDGRPLPAVTLRWGAGRWELA